MLKYNFLKHKKAQSVQGKLMNWTPSKFKTSALWKIILKKEKTRYTLVGKIHIHTYDKILMSRIYKGVL